MRRPGNLRGIGRLGHLGQTVSFNPINRANPFGPGNIMPTTAYATPTGYSINNPNPVVSTPTPSVAPTPTPVPASNITMPTTVTPTPVITPTPPATATTNNIPTTTVSTSPTAPHGPTCNCPQCASINGFSTSSGSSTPNNSNSTNSSSNSSTSTPIIMPGITASYTIPIPGYHYPLPGYQALPGITSTYTSANAVNTEYTAAAVPQVDAPIWKKPVVKLLLLGLVLAVALKKK